MSNNYYQLYIQKCQELAETIVIKSADSVTGINDELRVWKGANAVSEFEPESWKYYMTLAGEYHSTDTMMYVTSMDTLEKITFTKENLDVHRATRREYAFGTRYYNELKAQYPGQEALILGILNPVDKATAIAAKDRTILAYNPALVEANEYSLINKLQDWLYGYKVRWVNDSFKLSDELYPAYNHGIMYLMVLQAVVNFRLEMCKTNEAHSYHITQYLASHGYLDTYIDTLDRRQALWLYRNVEYINHNPGHRDTFEWLVENVLTARTVPLAEFTMRHSLTDQPEQDYPTLAFKRTPVNLGYNVDPNDTISLDALLLKEERLARDNSKYMAETAVTVKTQMENSLSNVLLTKALESNMIDRTGATPYTLEDILLNEWLHLASKGIYSAVIGVGNPRTAERMPMTAKEAYAVMIYCLFGSIGIELKYVADVNATRVQRIPTPTKADLRKLVDPSYVGDDYIDKALSIQPILVGSDKVISTEAFYNLCAGIYDSAQMQRGLIALQEHHLSRGMTQGMVSGIYADVTCELDSQHELYGKWLSDRNFKIADFTQNELGLLYVDILKNATGVTLNTTKSVKDLQAALVRLMVQLSSYSVQFLTTINQSSIKMLEWPVIRLGDHLSKVFGEFSWDTVPVEHVSTKGRGKEIIFYDLGIEGPQFAYHGHTKEQIRLEIIVKAHLPGAGEALPTVWHYRMNSAPVYVSLPEDAALDLEDVASNPNMLDFSYLTADEINTLRDVYNSTGA